MSRYFWMYYLLGLCSFTSQAALVPPPGFESLLEGQTEQIEVLLPGHSLGLFPVEVKPDTVQFMSPLTVLESSGLGALPTAERQKALAALGRPLPRNSNLVCGFSEAKENSECGYVATDKEDVAVIFDENNGQLSLFLNRDWLPDEERRDKRWLTPTQESVSAFIHRQTLYLSDDIHSRNMTLNGSGALGLGEGRFLGGNWAATWNQSENYNNSQAWFENLFVRQDLGNQYYLQAGRMDQRNLSGTTGGDFGFSLLPLKRFDGLRTGTTQAYVNHEVEQNATPVMVQVTRNARIDIYRGSELLGSQYLTPGMHTLDTHSLPPGSYPLALRVYEDGILRRTESQPFSKGGNSFSAQTQWFIQGGKEDTGDEASHYDGETVMAAGFRTGLRKNISLTEGISLAHDAWYSETRLNSQHAVLDGTLDLSAGILHGTDSTSGNTEQVTYNDGFSASLWRNHTESDACSGRHPQSVLASMTCQTSMNASLSVPVGNWYALLGYSTSRTEGRPVFRGYDDNSDNENVFWRQAYIPASHHESYQASANYSLNITGMNINTHGGVWRTRNDGMNDDGLFMSVSVSYAMTGSNGYTSAGVDIHSSRNQKTQTSWNVNHVRSWQQDLYRELSVGFSGYNDDSWSGSLGGRMSGRMGDLSGTVSNTHQRNVGNVRSVTAGYGSSLALSRDGLFWGSGQDGEPAAAIAVKVESEGDEGYTGKVASVRGSSQPFSLGFGQQSLLLMEGYNVTEVSIDDTGVSTQGMAGVKAGGGSGRYFLTPGHLLVHNINASVSRLYVGRALDKDGRPLLGAQPLNHPFPSLGVSGRFTLQSEHKESSLWLLSKNRILRCPLSVRKRRDVMQIVGDVRCELSAVDALPQALQISPRVIRLLNVAGLMNHSIQEA
ncbi:fimbrial outer membrane usher protein TcfC [Salmonella enterica]|nr:fimbrial outer membrane usher protein TcfC [Salmonella enterica]EIO8107220.1 fimbrial outer membrane usher protein TcfC [Salmonella enterica]ELV0712752.1 fimbrial outer membrane usher protein TcfC [Salmonella enterica]